MDTTPTLVDFEPLAIEQVKRRINAIQKLMQKVMLNKTHYGVIPGCGTKPALLKAGAELLCVMFQFSPSFQIQEKDLGSGHKEFIVTTSLSYRGQLVAQGVGSCSTLETKYRYRKALGTNTGKAVPQEYWKTRNQDLLGGKGFRAAKDPETGKYAIFTIDEKSENPDPADQYNTVLKMAKKRSLVDASITATGCSDIFTQDIDESVEVHAEVVQSAKVVPQDEQSQGTTTAKVFKGDDIPW